MILKSKTIDDAVEESTVKKMPEESFLKNILLGFVPGLQAYRIRKMTGEKVGKYVLYETGIRAPIITMGIISAAVGALPLLIPTAMLYAGISVISGAHKQALNECYNPRHKKKPKNTNYQT